MKLSLREVKEKVKEGVISNLNVNFPTSYILNQIDLIFHILNNASFYTRQTNKATGYKACLIEHI